MPESMDVYTTDLRRRMPDVLDHITRGGTVHVFRKNRHVAEMVPPGTMDAVTGVFAAYQKFLDTDDLDGLRDSLTDLAKVSGV